jgi:hypothetical protein
MGKAVLHFEKYGKATSGSLGNHIDRTEGKEYSYRHADLSKTKNNIYIKVNQYCSMDYNQAILQRVEDGYNARNKAGELKAIRKDAVYSVNAILSGTHEDLKDIEKDPQKMNKWIEKNLDFCKLHFGADNITRFAVHLDEKTPHIHCSFVPLTADGRLSANDIIGTGKKLEEFQTLYSNEMADFGLERGVKSDRKHHTTEEFRRRESHKLNENRDILKSVEELKQSDVFGFKAKKDALFSMLENLILKTDETTKKEIEALKSQINALETKNWQLQKEKEKIIITKKYIDEQTKQSIFDGFNLVDYFFSLANKGQLTFLKKMGNEYYFVDKDRKISVNANGKGYFDHKAGIGGQKIKAVMEFERLDWYKSMLFMNSFYGTDLSNIYSNIREEKKDLNENSYVLNAIFKPNNKELMQYFKGRGINQETIEKYAKQIHYQLSNGHYFGIGIKNSVGGWDIRSPKAKIKLGNSSYAEIGEGPNLVVLEGMTDFFSFIEILKEIKKDFKDHKVIILNSTNNADKFIQSFQNWNGNVSCILDSGTAGDIATNKILTYFGKQATDLRPEFNIGSHEHAYRDLNDVLTDNTNLKKSLKDEFTPDEIEEMNPRPTIKRKL